MVRVQVSVPGSGLSQVCRQLDVPKGWRSLANT